MYLKPTSSIIKHADFIIVDILSLCLSMLTAYLIRFPDNTISAFFSERMSELLICIVILLFSAIFTLNYHGILTRGMYAEFVSVIIISFCTFSINAILAFVLKISSNYSRKMFIYFALLFPLTDYCFRMIYKSQLKRFLKNKRKNKKRVFLVCKKDDLENAIKKINDDYINGYSIDAYCVIDSDNSDENDISLENAADYICRNWIDDVFIYCVGNSLGNLLDEFISHCREMAVTIHKVISVSDADERKYSIETIGGDTALVTAYNHIDMHQQVIKRCVDIVGSLVGSVVAILIIVIFGPIIYIKDPGPVIFKQKRVGKNGKTFEFLKLRTMYLNAEEMKKEYLANNRVADGMMFKMDNDPRVLPGIGKFLRNASLDEFPQFFNVLKGDMSIVGTRPPTIDEWEKYRYHHKARLAMLPGITGMWQVSGRSEITDFDEVVKLDTYYITHFRLMLDIQIILKTVVVLFSGRGAM